MAVRARQPPWSLRCSLLVMRNRSSQAAQKAVDRHAAEPYFPPEKVIGLMALGHRVRLGSLFGSAHSITIGPETLTGAADLRARGAAAAGY
jgi:gamma-glutamyltranspeptidase